MCVASFLPCSHTNASFGFVFTLQISEPLSSKDTYLSIHGNVGLNTTMTCPKLTSQKSNWVKGMDSNCIFNATLSSIIYTCKESKFRLQGQECWCSQHLKTKSPVKTVCKGLVRSKSHVLLY